MSYTLDQLLDATGVSEISGGRLVKNASAAKQPDLSKLAERCRRALEATPSEVDASNHQDLVEKTAAVAIISRTLAELAEIDCAGSEQIKTAAQSNAPDQALFIKTALEAGHSPHQIAEFLEKNSGVVGRIVRRVRAGKAERGYHRATKTFNKGKAQGERNMRDWQDLVRKAENAPDAEKIALLSRMRRSLGEQPAMNALSAMKSTSFKKLDAYKDLAKSVPAKAAKPGEAVNAAGKPLAASVGIGGKQVGLTKEQLKKSKKPAVYAGAGYLAHRSMSPSNDKPKSRRGPVIITG